MKGLRPIRVVQDLVDYLLKCPPNAEILLISEDGEGDGWPIGGVLQFEGPQHPQVWILLDEYSSLEPSSERIDWGGGGDEDEGPLERPGDMACALAAESHSSATKIVLPKADVVKIRGNLRSA